MEYAEKFKDPRWQKLRLKIFERDKWTCQMCGEIEETLCVHHRYYIQGKEPWEYSEEVLVTLCEECHEHERNSRPKLEILLLQSFKEKFFFEDINTFARAIHYMPFSYHSDTVANIFEWIVDSPKIFKELAQGYQKELEKRKEQR